MQITVTNTDGREEVRHIVEGTTLKNLLEQEMQVNPAKVAVSLNDAPIPSDALHIQLVSGARVRLTVKNYNSGSGPRAFSH